MYLKSTVGCYGHGTVAGFVNSEMILRVSLKTESSFLREQLLVFKKDSAPWTQQKPPLIANFYIEQYLITHKQDPVPTVQEAVWDPEPVWTQRLEEKSSAPVGDRTPAVQSVVRHCTDRATRLTFNNTNRNFLAERMFINRNSAPCSELVN
jgi:hypothetical protein